MTAHRRIAFAVATVLLLTALCVSERIASAYPKLAKAQKAMPVVREPLPSLADVLREELQAKSRLERYYRMGQPKKYGPRYGEAVLAKLTEWLASRPQDTATAVGEWKLLGAHRQQITAAFQSLASVYREKASFFYKDRPPMRIARGNKGLVILITGVDTDSIFNTQMIESRERAAKVIREDVFPKLATMEKSLRESGLESYGVVAFYGCRDFAEVSDPVAEAVAVVVPAAACRRFAEAIITEDQLLAASDVYLMDASMAPNFKKAKFSVR